MFPRPLARWTARRVLVAVGIGSVAMYVAYLGGADWYAGVLSDRWPAATGSVLESEVEHVPGHGRIAPRYKPHLSYRYEVNGRSYVCDRVSFGRLALGSGKRDAEFLIHQYPPGSAVQLYYDPLRPDQAVLQPGWTWSAVARTSLGIVVVVGVLVLGGRSRGLTSA